MFRPFDESQGTLGTAGFRSGRQSAIGGLGPLFLWATLLAMPSACAQQDFVEREAKIKAAYLYQFVNYVEWNPTAFRGPDSPLVIGVVGDDPVNKYLKLIAAQRKANNRRIEYREVSAPEQARGCHILFFAESVPDEKVRELIGGRQGEPVLLVGEKTQFLQDGGIIAFVIAGNNVRLQLSMKKAASHGLRVSSQLAKIANIVD